MPAEIDVEENPVAAASRSVLKPVTVGGYSPAIGPNKILSMGHTRASQLNHPNSDELSFLPKAAKIRNHLIAAGLLVAAIAVPYLGVKSASTFHNWQAERRAEEMRVKAEADAKTAQEAAAAQKAANELIEAQRREMAERAPRILADFVVKGAADANIPATPAAQLLSPESLKMWADAFWASERGEVPQFAQVLKADAAWAKPVQFVKIMDHTILVTAVVDDAGVRKVWVAVMQDLSGRGAGPLNLINSVSDIPGLDLAQLYVAPNFAKVGFQQIRDAITTALVTK